MNNSEERIKECKRFINACQGMNKKYWEKQLEKAKNENSDKKEK